MKLKFKITLDKNLNLQISVEKHKILINEIEFIVKTLRTLYFKENILFHDFRRRGNCLSRSK